VIQTQEASLQWLLYPRHPLWVTTQDPENKTDFNGQALTKAAFLFIQLKHTFPHQKRWKNEQGGMFHTSKGRQ